jgi:hypothetical protein
MYGICELLHGNNEVFPGILSPVSSPPGRASASKVIPSTAHSITIYHRLLTGDPLPSEEHSFGKKITVEFKQKVRTVIFVKIQERDDVLEDIINALPDTLPAVSGYSSAYLSKSISLIRDRDAIWDTEYSEGYRDKYQLLFQIYALEFDLIYTKCQNC